MSWDKSARPKRLRRRHKRLVILVALVGSIMIVGVVGVWHEFTEGESLGSITDVVSSMFTHEEKKTVWDGMSDEGKDVILKYVPDVVQPK